MAFAQNSSSSTSHNHRWTYEVFLSFRGEDTRDNFVDHLYSSLHQRSIITFKDDEKLDKGKSVKPEILKAIEESRFAIVVFSRDYASSSWCLDELLKIIECQQQTGLVVFPVFYDVDPSDVGHQRGTFRTSFQKHEEKLPEPALRAFPAMFPIVRKLENWREALSIAAKIAGWHIPKTRESKCINEIVGIILRHKQSRVVDNLIGIESRMQNVKSLLDMESDDVRIIGIWGMGGIGKTTVAQAVFREISYYFEGSSFVENVRENTPNDSCLASLQEKFLSDILMEKDLKVRNVYEGIDMISTRLCNKRVLLVLDDVDDVKQLEAFVGTHDWFGKKSRIIITTRDMHVLSAGEVDAVYEPDLLDKDQAIQLFCRYAFKSDSPTEGYEELSHRAVGYASCLPLALKVLGSYLRGRNVKIWESAMDRMAVLPEDGIHKVLKLSYDGLNDLEKEIFLDIACFFTGRKKELVTRILDSFDFHPQIGVSVLIEKSLVTLTKGRLQMHDLIKEMGWHIVRGLFRMEPGRLFSRLWLPQDISDVVTKNTAVEAIQGMLLDARQQVNVSSEMLTSTKKLRLLEVYDKLYNVDVLIFSHKPSCLPDELRYLKWDGYPFESLPEGFSKLVRLEILGSHIVKLWGGRKILGNLKVIKLTFSQNIRRFPDLTGAPNLERLILNSCKRLVELHPSVGTLKKLVFLNLRECSELRTLPSPMETKSLESLILSNCCSLKKFPDIARNMGRLSKIDLESSGVEQIPSSIGYLTGLVSINLRNCRSLKSLPDTICELKSLKTLDLSYCCSLQKFPDNIGSLKSLEELLLHRAVKLPYSINLLRNLRSLSFMNPDDRPFSPYSLSSLCSLRKLDLRYSNFLEKDFPCDLIGLSSLEELDLSHSKIILLPGSICQLSQLKVLKLIGCESLGELQELPSGLQVLSAYGCTSLKKLKDLSTKNDWLYKISLGGCYKLLENQQRNNYIADMLLQSLLQGRAVANHRFNFNIPGSQFPDWFRQQDISSRRDHTVLELLPNWHKGVMGFAVCCVIPYMPNKKHVEIGFRIANDIEYSDERDIGVPGVSDNSGAHLWIGYISFDFFLHIFLDYKLEDWSRVEGYLIIRIGKEVLTSRAHIVYRQDVEHNKMIGLGPHTFEYGTLDPFLADYEYDDETDIKPLDANLSRETAYPMKKGFPTWRSVMLDN